MSSAYGKATGGVATQLPGPGLATLRLRYIARILLSLLLPSAAVDRWLSLERVGWVVKRRG